MVNSIISKIKQLDDENALGHCNGSRRFTLLQYKQCSTCTQQETFGIKGQGLYGSGFFHFSTNQQII